MNEFWQNPIISTGVYTSVKETSIDVPKFKFFQNPWIRECSIWPKIELEKKLINSWVDKKKNKKAHVNRDVIDHHPIPFFFIFFLKRPRGSRDDFLVSSSLSTCTFQTVDQIKKNGKHKPGRFLLHPKIIALYWRQHRLVFTIIVIFVMVILFVWIYTVKMESKKWLFFPLTNLGCHQILTILLWWLFSTKIDLILESAN